MAANSSSTVEDSPHDKDPEGCDSTDIEDEEQLVLVAPPRRDQRQCQELHWYTAMPSVQSTQNASNSLVPSLLLQVGLLVVLIALPSLDVAVSTAVVATAAVSITAKRLVISRLQWRHSVPLLQSTLLVYKCTTTHRCTSGKYSIYFSYSRPALKHQCPGESTHRHRAA